MTESNKTAFEKRVKRRICAQSHDFYAVVAPGLENICLEELESISGSLAIKTVENGGISFTSGLYEMYSANLNLRTATRILMRIDEFVARSFQKFEKEFFNIPWELYLPQGCSPEISVTCSKCRIYHSDAIAERIREWISVILGPPSTLDEREKRQHIFIRGMDDRFVISLNTSGEPLYKRGVKEGSGLAPVRETLASGILRLAGYRDGMTLIDPMCGTGTFSIEAAMISKRIPAGYLRDFAFEDWPSFMDRKWEYLRTRAGEDIKSYDSRMIFPSDKDHEAIALLKRNIDNSNLYDIVSPVQADFFEIRAKDLDIEKGLVVLNPPYGKRLGNIYQGRQFFADICLKLKSDFRGWKLAILAPGDFFSARMPFKGIRLHDAFHGGLKLKVLTANI